LAKVLAQTAKRRNAMRAVDNFERLTKHTRTLDSVGRGAGTTGPVAMAEAFGPTRQAKLRNLAGLMARTGSVADAFAPMTGASKVSNLAKLMAGTNADRIGGIVDPTKRNRTAFEKLNAIATGTTAARIDASAAAIGTRNMDLLRGATGGSKYGTLARGTGMDALSPGVRAAIDPENMPGIRALRAVMDAAAGPVIDTTAFRSSFDRAVGATAAIAVRDVVAASDSERFEPTAAAASLPIEEDPNGVILALAWALEHGRGLSKSQRGALIMVLYAVWQFMDNMTMLTAGGIAAAGYVYTLAPTEDQD
jgi:hypothetical protein